MLIFLRVTARVPMLGMTHAIARGPNVILSLSKDDIGYGYYEV